MTNQNDLKNGPAAATILAAGIGSFFLGFMTSLSEGIKTVEGLLNWYNPSGPLVGKTISAIVLWLVAWAILGSRWKDREVDFDKIFKVALVLIALGLVGTFPLFFGLF